MGKRKGRFVLCLESGTYKASLEPRKVYRVLEDPAAEAKSLLRVVDESGEDYCSQPSLRADRGARAGRDRLRSRGVRGPVGTAPH